jgi:hypothetical protein
VLPEALALADVTGPATAVCNIVRHRGPPRHWLVWVHGAGMMRTVAEVRAVLRLLAPQSIAVALSGPSLGATAAMSDIRSPARV